MTNIYMAITVVWMIIALCFVYPAQIISRAIHQPAAN